MLDRGRRGSHWRLSSRGVLHCDEPLAQVKVLADLVAAVGQVPSTSFGAGLNKRDDFGGIIEFDLISDPV